MQEERSAACAAPAQTLDGGTQVFGASAWRHIGREKGVDAAAGEVFDLGKVQAGDDDERGCPGREMAREQGDEAMARYGGPLAAVSMLNGVQVYEHGVERLVIGEREQPLPG